MRVLLGQNEMVRRQRAFDWRETHFDLAERWPENLRMEPLPDLAVSDHPRMEAPALGFVH